MERLKPTPELLARRTALGKEIRARRTTLGVSQEELAHRSGLDRSYVGHIERGERNLGIDNLYRLAAALDCEARDLL